MFKDNGRLEPADKKEVAKTKSKAMFCPNCEKKVYITDVEFGNTICQECGTAMVDYNTTNAKLTGKIQ